MPPRQSAPPQLSPDGYWWWNGTSWAPTHAPLPGERPGTRAPADGLAVVALVFAVFGGLLISVLCAHESQKQAKRRHLEPSTVSRVAVGISLAWIGALVLLFLVVIVMAALS